VLVTSKVNQKNNDHGGQRHGEQNMVEEEQSDKLKRKYAVI
jgi:hypothetical protein